MGCAYPNHLRKGLFLLELLPSIIPIMQGATTPTTLVRFL